MPKYLLSITKQLSQYSVCMLKKLKFSLNHVRSGIKQAALKIKGM